MRLGHVSGVYGLRGEVRLFLYNPGSDLLFGGAEVDLVDASGSRRRVRLRARPGSGRRVLGRMERVETREQAELVVGSEVVVGKAELPRLDEGTWYHHQLVGLEAREAGGRVLGRVAEVVSSAGTDVLVIRGGACEEWVPVVPGAVVEVDLDRGEIVVADGAALVLG